MDSSKPTKPRSFPVVSQQRLEALVKLAKSIESLRSMYRKEFARVVEAIEVHRVPIEPGPLRPNYPMGARLKREIELLRKMNSAKGPK